MMSERIIQPTSDGSHTVYSPSFDATYHSIHGARQESLHVFIEAGLHHQHQTLQKASLSIFEMGFGTGLNALLSCQFACPKKLNIYYEAVEQFPLQPAEYQQLNYASSEAEQKVFQALHQSTWNETIKIASHFTIKKVQTDLLHHQPERTFDLIYFDAFAPEEQPPLWTTEIFDKMFHLLETGGVLVTYCCKGVVRRNLLSVGFQVEKLQGPPGKREMLRATR